jgi:hypothetical protein
MGKLGERSGVVGGLGVAALSVSWFLLHYWLHTGVFIRRQELGGLLLARAPLYIYIC